MLKFDVAEELSRLHLNRDALCYCYTIKFQTAYDTVTTFTTVVARIASAALGNTTEYYYSKLKTREIWILDYPNPMRTFAVVPHRPALVVVLPGS